MKTGYLLWLDDMRNPFLADWILQYAPDFDDRKDQIVWCNNFQDFSDCITQRGLPDEICFDHDLDEDLSGYDCAKWLVDYLLNTGEDLPPFSIQSQNPVGRENIIELFRSFTRAKG